MPSVKDSGERALAHPTVHKAMEMVPNAGSRTRIFAEMRDHWSFMTVGIEWRRPGADERHEPLPHGCEQQNAAGAFFPADLHLGRDRRGPRPRR